MGLPELIVIALIVLLFFGKDRLPGLFRSVGTSIRELKDGLVGNEPGNTTQPTQQAQSTPVAPAPTQAPAAPTSTAAPVESDTVAADHDSGTKPTTN